ncbi:hypothetical protein B0H21DRAFT_714219 [Amylocystis lapponica]|nr:hypothetical protein B0H21DRAFT_714219 [Amylocystis lapponica]
MWAPAKKSGAFTKEINGGHRHETLDAIHGDWNWHKVQNNAHSLYRAYTNMVAHRQRTEEFFKGFSETMTAELVDLWKDMSTEPELRTGEWTSVYRPTISKAPSQNKVFQELCAKEDFPSAVNGATVAAASSNVVFVQEGLRIQGEQRKLKWKLADTGTTPTETESVDITQIRKRLEGAFTKWRSIQLKHYPALQPHVARTMKVAAEDQKLWLPSDFLSDAERIQVGIHSLTSFKRALREAEANDALHSVKEVLKREALSTKFKQNHICGQKDCTRANDVIRAHVATKRKVAAKYREARTALLRLGHSENTGELPELTDDDLRIKWMDTRVSLGDGMKAESWIWMQGPQNETGKSGWSTELDHVKWFWSRADRDRWREEIEKCEIEFKCSIAFHAGMEKVWRELVKRCNGDRRTDCDLRIVDRIGSDYFTGFIVQ